MNDDRLNMLAGAAQLEHEHARDWREFVRRFLRRLGPTDLPTVDREVGDDDPR